MGAKNIFYENETEIKYVAITKDNKFILVNEYFAEGICSVSSLDSLSIIGAICHSIEEANHIIKEQIELDKGRLKALYVNLNELKLIAESTKDLKGKKKEEYEKNIKWISDRILNCENQIKLAKRLVVKKINKEIKIDYKVENI